MKILLLAFLISNVTLSFASTIRAPAQLQTIQAALDSISDGDTVLVSLGTYHESLQAPPIHFTLKGDVHPDTGDFPRPVIDPSTLPHPDTVVCMNLPQESSPVLEDLIFRNGPQMFPRTADRLGGVYAFSNSMVLRRCLFDSTCRGLLHQFFLPHPNSVIDTLQDCVFRYNRASSFDALDWTVIATNCRFESGSVWNLCRVGAGSQISSCTFGGQSPVQNYLVASGDHIRISNCVFGPSTVSIRAALSGGPNNSGYQVTNCTFRSLIDTVAAISINTPSFNAFSIDSCLFSEITTLGTGACVVVDSGNVLNLNRSGTISNNTFVSCVSHVSHANFIMCETNNWIVGNHFTLNRNEINGLPAIYVPRGDQTQIHNNFFNNTGFALKSDAPSVDAELNWWGSALGPYHEILNPIGRGDSIVGDVDFEPWLTDPNPESVPGSHQQLPAICSLSAFPNPFNVTSTLVLQVTSPGIYRVELFDILGRRAEEIYRGHVEGEQRFSVDGTNLSSGIYFVSASNVIENKPEALTKLMLLK